MLKLGRDGGSDMSRKLAPLVIISMAVVTLVAIGLVVANFASGTAPRGATMSPENLALAEHAAMSYAASTSPGGPTDEDINKVTTWPSTVKSAVVASTTRGQALKLMDAEIPEDSNRPALAILLSGTFTDYDSTGPATKGKANEPVTGSYALLIYDPELNLITDMSVGDRPLDLNSFGAVTILR